MGSAGASMLRYPDTSSTVRALTTSAASPWFSTANEPVPVPSTSTLPSGMVSGFRMICGLAPVPPSATFASQPSPSQKLTTRLALSSPTATGANDTVMVLDSPAAMVRDAAPTRAKRGGAPPLSTASVITASSLPMFSATTSSDVLVP